MKTTITPSRAGRIDKLKRGLRRRISRRTVRRLLLFAGRSNPSLAERIGEELGVELGRAQLETFANGEVYCRYPESIRGADVFIVQTGSPPVNDHLVELLLMVDAAKLSSAHRITAVLPLYPYARRTRSRLRASRSAPGWSPRCCRSPASTGCSRWTCTRARSRASSRFPSTT